jgi:hypothetical protein
MGTINSSPYYSYLNQLTTATANSNTTAVTDASKAGTAQNADNVSLVTSLLGGGSSGGGFSAEALTLLQPSDSGNFDEVTSLLGGTGTSTGVTNLLSDVYANSAAAALTQAQYNAGGTTAIAASSASGASAKPAFTSAQNLINAQTQASVAYNQTVLQNAQSVLTNNNYGPDGVTPIVT